MRQEQLDPNSETQLPGISMFSCCRCVNPKSPKLKEKSKSDVKGGSDKLSDSEDSHEEEEKQSKQQNETNSSACKISAVDNLSQDDEEIKIEIIENSDNLQSYSGCSAATTAVLNGSSPEPKETEVVGSEFDTHRDASPSSPLDTQPVATGPSDVEKSPDHSNPVDFDEKATENNAADFVQPVVTGSASSSPASKTLSSTDRGQTDDQSALSSGAITEIEAKLPNESTDADSTGDATNTPQEIPTTIGELVEEQDDKEQTITTLDGDAECENPMSENGIAPVSKSPTVELPRENANEVSIAPAPPPTTIMDLSYAGEQEQQPPAQVDEADERILSEDPSIDKNSVVREQPEHELQLNVEGEKSQANDDESTPHTANIPDEEPTADFIPPPPVSSDEAVEVEGEQQLPSVSVASKIERLKSEPSNSEETIEETIDVKRFLPQQHDDSKSDDDNPLSSSSDDGGSVEVSTVPNDIIDNEDEPRSFVGVKDDQRSDELCTVGGNKFVERSDKEDGGGDSLTPSPPDAVGSPEVERDEEEMETAANAANNSNDQVSKNSTEERESNNDDTTSTLSESIPNTATNGGGSTYGIEDNSSSSRKESVNSDDTTIRTQVSFRESCLSRRSSSKSSIKKKVAYNDSTEVIPPPEYPPPEDDDSVFSDSVPAKLPRGDMCTPYATKRGSLPGMIALPDWFAEDRLMMEEGGIMEPPTTPIGRDELALRRHRFFSELLNAAHAAVEHRVRFDPLGPEIAKVPTEEESEDCDPDLKPSSARELECLIDRLERIVDRLERTVSARELEETRRILKDACVVGKAVIRSNTGTNTEHRASTGSGNQCGRAAVDNDDLPTVLPSTPPPSASYLHQQVDNLESSLFPALTDQPARTERHRELSTVIHTKPSAILTHTNPLPTQEQGNAVLSISLSQPGAVAANKMSINAYEDIMVGSFANFIALSNKIGGDVATQAQFVKEAFDAQFAFLKVAAASSAPSNTDLQTLLKPTSDKIATIQSFREKNRTSPFFNHLSAISESIPALGWVCVAPTPGPYVKEMNDAGQFYTNRVLKDWKEKDSTHVEWARGWIQTLTELQQYIKQHHTTGLVWSGKDKPATGGASVPPPPPPLGGLPPPPPVLPIGDLSIGGAGDDRSALFAQINQGADITKGLKKVTADMQTHKNPGLRSGPAPYKAPAGVTNGTKSVAAPAISKPPTFTRDGKKWLIEYQKNNAGLVVENAEMNNVVYMFRCEGSTLQIKGKINSVVMDSCKKCSLVFDSLVASAEFVNCQSVQMQVLGKVPTISIDKTDGCQMYLSADSLDVEIVSSKSSEMNVMIPKGASGDYTEQPIPEQFKTIVKGSSLNTTCVESLG
uniref:Adenylyl cyclase-associated protein n=1 Tax=Anopheles farauti TaxID=69004 RepID=A0A182QPI5_9DIPT